MLCLIYDLEFDMLIWFGFDVDLALYFDFHFDFEFGLNSGSVNWALKF